MYPKNAHIHTHIHILGHSWLGKDKYTVPLKRSASIPLKKKKISLSYPSTKTIGSLSHIL